MRNRLLALLLLASCNGAAKNACDRCVADTQPHCVNDVCTDDADCPAGATCATEETQNLACTSGVTFPRCAAIPARVRRQTLVNGFVTTSMDLTIGHEPLSLNWKNPSTAQFVACAVFSCFPIFRSRVEGDAIMKSKQFIANANACVVELQETSTPRAHLELDGQRRTVPETCSDPQKARAAIDQLLVGCWAYDDHEVVGATDLLPLAPEDYATVAGDLVVDAQCRNELDDCYDADRKFFGACVSGLCQPRCTALEDCELAGDRWFDEPIGAPCRWAECRTIPDSEIGVCVRN
jgi:hypothetical protein